MSSAELAALEVNSEILVCVVVVAEGPYTTEAGEGLPSHALRAISARCLKVDKSYGDISWCCLPAAGGMGYDERGSTLGFDWI